MIGGRSRRAISSFRLRLHTGVRQSGSVFDPLFIGMAEAMPYRSSPGGARGGSFAALRMTTRKATASAAADSLRE
jgi:hypothetical protein